MTGNDVLHVFFSGEGKDALTSIQKGKVDRAIELVGEELVRQLYDNDYGLRLVLLAERVSKYCGKEGKRFLQTTVKYIMKHGGGSLDSAIDMKSDASIIMGAITEKKQLKLTISKSE